MNAAGLTGELIFVSYHAGMPFAAWLREPTGRVSIYDMDWCARDQIVYWHLSAGGRFDVVEVGNMAEDYAEPVMFWVAPGVPWTGGKWMVRLDEPLAPDPFEDACESDTAWCDACDDRLPVGEGDSVCDHLAFCLCCSDYMLKRYHESLVNIGTAQWTTTGWDIRWWCADCGSAEGGR